eukprot:749319-Pelagomonas_calceolata.AAC.2
MQLLSGSGRCWKGGGCEDQRITRFSPKQQKLVNGVPLRQPGGGLRRMQAGVGPCVGAPFFPWGTKSSDMTRWEGSLRMTRKCSSVHSVCLSVVALVGWLPVLLFFTALASSAPSHR